MKRLFFICLLQTCFIISYGQITYGPYTLFPNNKSSLTTYNPKLAFGKIDNQYLLVLSYVDPKSFALFNNESVLLLKFDDDSVYKLPLSFEDEIITKHTRVDVGLLRGGLRDYYTSFVSFNIEKEAIDRIIDKQIITKIRVSFTNGDIKDWDIEPKYQSTFIKGLLESYKEVEAEFAERKERINNIEADF